MYHRIRDLREDADLTQTQMAQMLHCSQRIYSNYECGDVDIPTRILIQLAELHKTSIFHKKPARKGGLFSSIVQVLFTAFSHIRNIIKSTIWLSTKGVPA